MRLLFKQRMFSWFDSYDIYDESGNTVFVVKGQLAWGHRLEIYDAVGNPVGTVKEEILTFLPRFALYAGGQYLGDIRKELTFLRPAFTLHYGGWTVQGDVWSWNYQVMDGYGRPVAQATKQLFNWTDTYFIDVIDPANVLLSLMIVLAIDAAKCSSGG